jgi:hypothetical protein
MDRVIAPQFRKPRNPFRGKWHVKTTDKLEWPRHYPNHCHWVAKVKVIAHYEQRLSLGNILLPYNLKAREGKENQTG